MHPDLSCIMHPVSCSVAEESEGKWKGIVGRVKVFQKYLLKTIDIFLHRSIIEI